MVLRYDIKVLAGELIAGPMDGLVLVWLKLVGAHWDDLDTLPLQVVVLQIGECALRSILVVISTL
jgi:hypothetical protein